MKAPFYLIEQLFGIASNGAMTPVLNIKTNYDLIAAGLRSNTKLCFNANQRYK